MLGLLACGKPMPTSLKTTVSLLASAKELAHQCPEYWACVQRDLSIEKEALREHVQVNDFGACGGYWLEGIALGAVGIGQNRKQWAQAIALAIAVAIGVTQRATPSNCSDVRMGATQLVDDFSACVEQAAKLLEALPPPPPRLPSPHDSNAPPPPAGPTALSVGADTPPAPAFMDANHRDPVGRRLGWDRVLSEIGWRVLEVADF